MPMQEKEVSPSLYEEQDGTETQKIPEQGTTPLVKGLARKSFPIGKEV